MKDDPDRHLAARARRGEQDAIEELFRRHWREAWRAACVLAGSEADADDIAQDAFVKALRGLSTFKGRSTFRTWLHRIVVNEVIDRRRSSARRAAVIAPPPEELSLPEQPAEDGRALALLAVLPFDQRSVVVLRYLLDFSLSEVAELLGVPIGTVQSRASRGLATMRSQLGAPRG